MMRITDTCSYHQHEDFRWLQIDTNPVTHTQDVLLLLFNRSFSAFARRAIAQREVKRCGKQHCSYTETQQ